MNRILPTRVWRTVGIAVWLVATAAGLKALLDYQVAPGAPAAPPESWPSSSQFPRATHGSTLLVIAHPHCPCTRATMGELAQIMARTQGKLEAQVLFVVPKGIDASWAETDIWRAASAIPGVHAYVDMNGDNARLFGAATSGQALLYGDNGQLQFAGGITSGRGHEGDNAGSDAIVSMINSRRATRSSTPVFGCALASPSLETEGRRPRCPN